MLIVDTCYPAFLERHYRERPKLRRRPYPEQLAALMAGRFGTSDAYSHELRRLGHEAAEVVVNCDPLQRAWAREHGVARLLRALDRLPTRAGVALRRAARHAIAHAQVDDHSADVVYVQDLWFFTRRELDRLRASGRLVVGQIASTPPGEDVLRGFDLLVTSFPHFVERFWSLGVDAAYLPIAFDARLLDEVAVDGPRPHRAVFVGGLDPRVHPGGVGLLERLVGRMDLEIWGYGVEELPPASPIIPRHRGEAWGLDMYGVLARSEIVVNRHIEAAEGHANNMRMYEATGMGALLVTEAAPNLADLFAPGEEVVSYATEDELVERVRALLEDEPRRSRTAAAGHARTLSEHTYERRIAQLAAELEARVR